MKTIDGSYLEGGGSIIRITCALSAITKTPVRIENIRANRPDPGLKTQHLEGLKALTNLCNGELRNGFLGSKEIEFYPKKIISKHLKIKISTAGSVGLIFQILKLPACVPPEGVTIRVQGGGTFGKYAPPLIYTQNILLPVLRETGYKADIRIQKHGFFPKGGAEVEMVFHSVKRFLPVNMEERGEMTGIKGISIASKHLEKARVAERQTNSAKKTLLEKTGVSPEIETKYVESDCPGSGILLWCEFENGRISGDALGERGKPAELVGKEACENLIKDVESGASVDKYLSDQILPFMALADGKSSVTVPVLTNHAKTNMWVIQRFFPVEFEVKKEGKYFKVSCEGVGFDFSRI